MATTKKPARVRGRAVSRRPEPKAAARPKMTARPMAAKPPAFRTVGELASVIRSKNAKAFGLTLDMLFPDRATYERVKQSRVINKRTIARLYGITDNEVLSVIEFDPGNAIKATIRRPIPCGGFGDADVYGCQQHAPLFDIRIPWGD